MNGIPVKDFGKDHWSLLAYVGTRNADYDCTLNRAHLRTKNQALATTPLGQNFWKEEYSTRLFGYWNEDGTKNPKRKLKKHDDFDCLDDLEAAGFIEEVGTMVNPYAKLTEEGARICGLLIKHKSEGKQYATFVLEVPLTKVSSESKGTCMSGTCNAPKSIICRCEVAKFRDQGEG